MKFSCSNSHFWVPRIKVWYNGAAEVGVGNDSIVWFIDVKGRHFVSGSPGLGWLQQEPYSLENSTVMIIHLLNKLLLQNPLLYYSFFIYLRMGTYTVHIMNAIAKQLFSSLLETQNKVSCTEGTN